MNIEQVDNGFVVTVKSRNGTRETTCSFQSMAELQAYIASYFDYRSGPLKGDKK